MGGANLDKISLAPFLAKRIKLLSTTLWSRSDEYKTKLVQDFKNDCLSGFSDGTFKPIIDKVFKISEIQEAHRLVESNTTIGKVFLVNDFN